MIEPTPTPTPPIVRADPPPFGCPIDCETVIVVPEPAPDELAYTGPIDVVSAALGGLVLLWAGLALRGRKSPVSSTGSDQ